MVKKYISGDDSGSDTLHLKQKLQIQIQTVLLIHKLYNEWMWKIQTYNIRNVSTALDNFG